MRATSKGENFVYRRIHKFKEYFDLDDLNDLAKKNLDAMKDLIKNRKFFNTEGKFVKG